METPITTTTAYTKKQSHLQVVAPAPESIRGLHVGERPRPPQPVVIERALALIEHEVHALLAAAHPCPVGREVIVQPFPYFRSALVLGWGGRVRKSLERVRSFLARSCFVVYTRFGVLCCVGCLRLSVVPVPI